MIPYMNNKQYKIAIVGATGLVGRTALKVLEEKNFSNLEYTLFASKKSAGNKVSFLGKDYTIQELKEDSFDEDSKVTRNYRHFYDLLTRKPQALSFDQLLDAIERLQIISIELDSDDDAQLIFESLNSTGLALTEADKILDQSTPVLPM